jgi:hypothetical protein
MPRTPRFQLSHQQKRHVHHVEPHGSSETWTRNDIATLRMEVRDATGEKLTKELSDKVVCVFQFLDTLMYQMKADVVTYYPGGDTNGKDEQRSVHGDDRQGQGEGR